MIEQLLTFVLSVLTLAGGGKYRGRVTCDPLAEMTGVWTFELCVRPDLILLTSELSD